MLQVTFTTSKQFDHIFCVTINRSHKKQKDSLEGSLDRVLFAAELEFPKILVPRLPQHKSNVNIKYAAESAQNGQNNSIIYMGPASCSTDTS